MEEERQKEKKEVLKLFLKGNKGDLVLAMTNYFKKYCVSDCIVETEEKNGDFGKKEPYDILTAPLLSFT